MRKPRKVKQCPKAADLGQECSWVLDRGYADFLEPRKAEVCRIRLPGTSVNILRRPSCTSTDCVWHFNSPSCCPRKPLPRVLLRSS
jgi:hypothetical protein